MKVIIRNGVPHPLVEMVDGVQTSFNVENDCVNAYLSNVTYTDADVLGDTETRVRTYISAKDSKNKSGNWAEHPRPVILTGTTSGATIEVETDGHSQTVVAESGATRLYNLIPQKHYAVKQLGTGGTVTRTWTFDTTGSKRMIKGDFRNFRDIGGWQTSNGTLAYGKIFRGFGVFYKKSNDSFVYPSSSNIANTVELFKELGITEEFDMQETSHNPSYPLGSGISYVNIPLQSYDHMTMPTITYRYVNGVKTDITPEVNPYYANMKSALENISSVLSEGGAVYLHCYSGADRTGTLVAILMAITGCSIDSIIKEWELTMFDTNYEETYISRIFRSSGNLRTFLRIVYAMEGVTLQDKVIRWLTGTLGVSQLVIAQIQNVLWGLGATSMAVSCTASNLEILTQTGLSNLEDDIADSAKSQSHIYCTEALDENAETRDIVSISGDIEVIADSDFNTASVLDNNKIYAVNIY